jgi:hypothetical protein
MFRGFESRISVTGGDVLSRVLHVSGRTNGPSFLPHEMMLLARSELEIIHRMETETVQRMMRSSTRVKVAICSP